MRSDIPPPGRAMSFSEWSEAIVAGGTLWIAGYAVRDEMRLVTLEMREQRRR
jgi:hypothetical protein